MNHESGVQRVSAVLDDVRRLLQDPEGPVSEQHVVSHVLLKRFVGHTGRDARRIIPFNLARPASKQPSKSPKECGKVRDFVKFGSGHLERDVWKPTEDALPAAFAAVDNGTLFDHPEHVATVKDAIVLHYVRSTQIRDMQRGMWPSVVTTQFDWWLGPGAGMLDRAYYLRYGLHPGGVQERRRFLEEMAQPWVDAAETELLFDARLEQLFRQGCALIDGFGLEILTPVRGQFLIGDVPALTVRHDRPEAGVRHGIPIGDAHSVVLPLGPRHLAAVGPADHYSIIPVELRDRLNAIQVQEAERYVYFQPGSGLEAFVRSQPRFRVLHQPFSTQ